MARALIRTTGAKGEMVPITLNLDSPTDPEQRGNALVLKLIAHDSWEGKLLFLEAIYTSDYQMSWDNVLKACFWFSLKHLVWLLV